jgi:hypothetical protein
VKRRCNGRLRDDEPLDIDSHRRCLSGANAIVTELEPRPTLVLNPAGDEEFRSAAVHLVESGVLEPALLQDCLRLRWPRAIVRPRELAGEQDEVWYVYRDGHWVPSND